MARSCKTVLELLSMRVDACDVLLEFKTLQVQGTCPHWLKLLDSNELENFLAMG